MSSLRRHHHCRARATLVPSPPPPRAPSRPVNSGRCEHHQRAAGTFNGSTRSFSIYLSLSFSFTLFLLLSLLSFFLFFSLAFVCSLPPPCATPAYRRRPRLSVPFPRVSLVYHGPHCRVRHSSFLFLVALSSSSIRHSLLGSPRLSPPSPSLSRFLSAPPAPHFDFSGHPPPRSPFRFPRASWPTVIRTSRMCSPPPSPSLPDGRER